MWGKIVVGVALTLLALQLWPLDRENPPVEEEVPAPPEVRAVLERACYDCHSNETRWPWYAWVAPASILVVHDVEHAREHMNFSTWNRYDEKERRELREEAWEEVRDGDMPLPIYLPLHPDAVLSAQDRETLRTWATGASPGP